jgi:hypothetical protein
MYNGYYDDKWGIMIILFSYIYDSLVDLCILWQQHNMAFS